MCAKNIVEEEVSGLFLLFYLPHPQALDIEYASK